MLAMRTSVDAAMTENVRNPATPAEWQEAVNAAAFWLLVDSARQYGLITAPKVDADRCEELLTEGRKRGVLPQDQLR